jgi:predicted lipid-binding transport protein (Tim44 family)
VRRTALLAVVLALLALPSAAALGQSATTGSQAQPGATTGANESRIGGRSGFGRSRPRISRARPRTRVAPSRRRQTRRPLFGGGFFGSVLRFLGIAYLVNMLFGWGPGGGSPLGLLIVLGVILWLATRRRRRRPLYY